MFYGARAIVGYERLGLQDSCFTLITLYTTYNFNLNLDLVCMPYDIFLCTQ